MTILIHDELEDDEWRPERVKFDEQWREERGYYLVDTTICRASGCRQEIDLYCCDAVWPLRKKWLVLNHGTLVNHFKCCRAPWELKRKG